MPRWLTVFPVSSANQSLLKNSFSSSLKIREKFRLAFKSKTPFAGTATELLPISDDFGRFPGCLLDEALPRRPKATAFTIHVSSPAMKRPSGIHLLQSIGRIVTYCLGLKPTSQRSVVLCDHSVGRQDLSNG